jgi:hypothetical protein
MKKLYSVIISNRLVIFDLSTALETIHPGTREEDLYKVYENEDYKLLHNFRMAYHSKQVPDSKKDYIAIKYVEMYDELLSKVKSRFPDFEFDSPE